MKFNETQEKYYEKTVTTADGEKTSAFQHIVNLINIEQLNHKDLFQEFNFNNRDEKEKLLDAKPYTYKSPVATDPEGAKIIMDFDLENKNFLDAT